MLADMEDKTGIQDGLLSLNDLAGYLACSRTYARKLIVDGTLPSCKIGSLRRVRRADVDRYVETRLAAKD